jgi:Putative peptidoglycan binding domain
MQQLHHMPNEQFLARAKQQFKYTFWLIGIGLLGLVLSSCATNEAPDVPNVKENVQPATMTDRAAMIARAEEWLGVVDFRDPDYYGNAWGYRQDCSGYVSYIWGLESQPSTASFGEYSYEISVNELQPGDALNKPRTSSTEYNGHIVLFGGWVDQNVGSFVVYEVKGKAGVREPGNGAQKSIKDISAYLQESYHPIRSNAFAEQPAPPPPSPAPSSWPTLSRGSSDHSLVMTFQYLINANGAGLVIDGDFGPQTEQVVKYVQGLNGGAQTGVVDESMWLAVIAPFTLQQGSQGLAVKALQQRLTDKGYPLEVDGDFGSVTAGVVSRFQQDSGLGADGVVGSQTWQVLLN